MSRVGLNCFSSGLPRVWNQSQLLFLCSAQLADFWNFELSFRALAFGRILLPGAAMTHLLFALGYTVARRQVTADLFMACLLCRDILKVFIAYIQLTPSTSLILPRVILGWGPHPSPDIRLWKPLPWELPWSRLSFQKTHQALTPPQGGLS